MCNCSNCCNSNCFSNVPNNILPVENNTKDFIKSVEGKCFAGVSNNVSFGKTLTAWCGLINPKCSCINCFLDEFTVCNFSSTPCVAKLYLNALPANPICLSPNISPCDTSICPSPCPRCKIVSSEKVSYSKLCGVNVLQIVVPPASSITTKTNGKFICPSCGSCIIQLETLDTLSESVCNVSFSWWEDPFIITSCSGC